jgi:hypothetical protein
MQLTEREEKLKLCQQIISLQADFRIKTPQMSVLRNMRLDWLKEYLQQLKNAELSLEKEDLKTQNEK